MATDGDADGGRSRSATVSGGGATATASGSPPADAGVWPIADGAADDADGPSGPRGRTVGPPGPDPELDRFLAGLDDLRAALDADADADGPQADAWPQAAVSLDGEDARRAAELRVVPIRGGVYRGQAVRRGADGRADEGADADGDADGDAEWVPCGYGVWTRCADGRSILGRWAPAFATCCGLSLRPGLSFEGEWADAADVSGVGVGVLAFGAVFSGPWASSAPRGIGELVLLGPREQAVLHRGWARGLRCVRPCGSTATADACEVARDARRRFPDQPQRGLAVAALALDRWRAKVLRRVMGQLRRGACLQSVRAARLARLDAVRARNLALEAEARAIHAHVETQQQAQRVGHQVVAALVLQSRAGSDKRRRTRERHAKRRAEAQEQLELAHACLQRQREAVDALESELDATLELLAAARQAQTDCHAAASELAALKRRVETESVQINALKQRIRDGQFVDPAAARELDTDGGALAMALGLPPSRPTTAMTEHVLPRGKTAGAALSQVDVLTVEAAEALGESVCDVPGCGCGIPRDVFLRVASTLNGGE